MRADKVDYPTEIWGDNCSGQLRLVNLARIRKVWTVTNGQRSAAMSGAKEE